MGKINKRKNKFLDSKIYENDDSRNCAYQLEVEYLKANVNFVSSDLSQLGMQGFIICFVYNTQIPILIGQYLLYIGQIKSILQSFIKIKQQAIFHNKPPSPNRDQACRQPSDKPKRYLML